LLLCIFAFLPLGVRAATNDLSTALQQGLFEEEANRNLPAAIEAYEAVAKQFDQNRALAATAIFRLGEVNRKLGKTNEAAVFYQRILREFGDQDTLATLSRQNLTGLGLMGLSKPATDASLADLESQYSILSLQLEQARADSDPSVTLRLFRDEALERLYQRFRSLYGELTNQSSAKTSPPVVHAATEMRQVANELRVARELLLEKQSERLASLKESIDRIRAGMPVASASGQPAIVPVLDSEDAEIARLRAMIQNSPDLINAPGEGAMTPLSLAASKGQLRVARFLLDHGADINRRSSGSIAMVGMLQTTDATPLHYAAASGHRAMVELLLERGAAVDARSKEGLTPLHLTANRGFQSVSEALLNGKADVNAPDQQGRTPLHLAARFGHSALTTFLANNGARVDEADNSGSTPLMLAVNNGHLDVVKSLLTAKAKPDVMDQTGRTALSYAAEAGHLEIVRALLEAEADPNAGKNSLPLHCAIKSSSTGIVQALLEADADPNTTCVVGWPVAGESPGAVSWTPLAMAVKPGNVEAVKLLLKFKADPNDPPVILDATHQPEVLKALLTAGAKPNVDNGQGRTPLMIAVDGGQADSVRVLLAHGADTEVAPFGYTPLFQAVDRRDHDTAEALLKGGASPNARPRNDGRTALHFAAGNGDVGMTELLLVYKADVNARTPGGQTALHIATQARNQPLISLLLSYDADVNARDDQGRTPLDLLKDSVPVAGGMAVPIPPAPVIRAAGSPQAQAPTAAEDEIADLLLKHGGQADLPDWTSIRVTRQGVDQLVPILRAHTNDWNRFTVLEVLRRVYSSQNIIISGRRLIPRDLFAFPDLTRVVVHRPSRTPDGKGQEIKVNLLNSTNGVDCAGNIWLEFGDVIEIPERERTLNETTDGRIQAYTAAMDDCIRKRVQLIVREQSKDLDLRGWAYLTDAMQNMVALSLLRTSSDLTRVKVTRKDPTTGKTREFVVDVAAHPSETSDLWLRDGDVIEVPEKE
jgi:ankyrin repeat protein